MENKEIKINSNLVYDGKMLKIYKDDVMCSNGCKSIREVVRHPGGACILALYDNKIVFEHQFRYPYNEEILELPAGKIENGEDPILTAKRELQEETGLIPENLEYYGCIYPSCGYTDEIIYLYYSKNNIKGKTNFDKDEVIDIELIDIKKAYEMLDNFEIKDAKTICLMFKLRKELLDNDK